MFLFDDGFYYGPASAFFSRNVFGKIKFQRFSTLLFVVAVQMRSTIALDSGLRSTRTGRTDPNLVECTQFSRSGMNLFNDKNESLSVFGLDFVYPLLYPFNSIPLQQAVQPMYNSKEAQVTSLF
jgi:hypothetical protein